MAVSKICLIFLNFWIVNPDSDGLREGCTTLAQIDRINGKLPKSPLLGYYNEIDKVSQLVEVLKHCTPCLLTI